MASIIPIQTVSPPGSRLLRDTLGGDCSGYFRILQQHLIYLLLHGTGTAQLQLEPVDLKEVVEYELITNGLQPLIISVRKKTVKDN